MKPAHVAIIMDGNSRWAEKRGLPRLAGHQAGVNVLRQTIDVARDLGIFWLTVYAFSLENWSRPKSEVDGLMRLLKHFVRKELSNVHRSGVRVRVIGNRESLAAPIRNLLEETEQMTLSNTGMNLIVAFSYAGRDEIVRASRRIAQKVQEGEIDPENISIDCFSRYIDTFGIPDPDLVIRTSGEMRLSNFLMWQTAYSELVFLPCLWPDFNRDEFCKAIQLFQERKRRFGSREEKEFEL